MISFHWNVVCKGQKSNNIIIHMPWKILKNIFHFIINHEKNRFISCLLSLFFPKSPSSHTNHPVLKKTQIHSSNYFPKNFQIFLLLLSLISCPVHWGTFISEPHIPYTPKIHKKPERDSHQLVATQVFREVWGRFWIILDGRRCRIYEKASLIPWQAQKIWAK